MRLAVVGRRIARRWWSTTNDGNHTFAGRWSATTNDGDPTLAGRWRRGIARRLKPRAHATKPAAAGWWLAPVGNPRRRAWLCEPAT